MWFLHWILESIINSTYYTYASTHIQYSYSVVHVLSTCVQTRREGLPKAARGGGPVAATPRGEHWRESRALRARLAGRTQQVASAAGGKAASRPTNSSKFSGTLTPYAIRTTTVVVITFRYAGTFGLEWHRDGPVECRLQPRAWDGVAKWPKWRRSISRCTKFPNRVDSERCSKGEGGEGPCRGGGVAWGRAGGRGATVHAHAAQGVRQAAFHLAACNARLGAPTLRLSNAPLVHHFLGFVSNHLFVLSRFIEARGHVPQGPRL